jgi:parallel beta-helix repeat protein
VKRSFLVFCVFLLAPGVVSADPRADAKPDVPVLEVTKDTTLDAKKTYGRLIVKNSNVTIDGQGAWVIGTDGSKPKTYKGVGIEAKGVSGVTLKNANVRGFETGLRIENGEKWTIEGCNFSDNFHDPAFGWGENGRRGGILLVNVRDSTIKNCKTNRVWDGCVLVHSDRNTITGNDFSHCSNTCLKLWHSCDNRISGNKLDYGIRIKPGEVHARDSTCVLIETGSDGNSFLKNSCTHGGDGIFIRSLNNWVSTRNHFEENDCSYANNNGFECWSPGNTFYRNKANHCSYGFWMGGSDRTVLDGNEASFNGDPNGHHNSPHLPKDGHAGIVFMFGSASNVVVRGNTCTGNNGAGIAAIGDQGSRGEKWKAYHWVVDANKLTDNRWGIFAEYADWIDAGANVFKGNTSDVHKGPGVTNFTERPAAPGVTQAPQLTTVGPEFVRVGTKWDFRADSAKDPAGKPLSFRWDFGDGTVSTDAKVEHAFAKPGFYRVGVTVTNGSRSALTWRNVYAVSEGQEVGTEGQAAKWDWVDERSKVVFADDAKVKLVGKSSVRAEVGPPYSGGRTELRFTLPAKGGIDPARKTSLTLWLRARNPNVPGWQDGNPLVTLYGPDGAVYRIKPKGEPATSPADSEAREGWLRLVIPLRGDAFWTTEGKLPKSIERFSLGFDSWGGDPFVVWLDGIQFE